MSGRRSLVKTLEVDSSHSASRQHACDQNPGGSTVFSPFIQKPPVWNKAASLAFQLWSNRPRPSDCSPAALAPPLTMTSLLKLNRIQVRSNIQANLSSSFVSVIQPKDNRKGATANLFTRDANSINHTAWSFFVRASTKAKATVASADLPHLRNSRKHVGYPADLKAHQLSCQADKNPPANIIYEPLHIFVAT